MTHYQAVVIGFGKAGKTLAALLARKGQTVALIEQSAQMYGGTCINIGCIPTKTLVHEAQSGTPFAQAMARKQQVVGLLHDKNYHNLADLPGVTLMDGHAEFIDEYHLRVTTPAGEQQISADRIFINTGAKSVLPPINGIQQTPQVYDSTGLLQLTQLPQRLLILGAGYIGVEFAAMFRQFSSQVTMLELMPQFLPREDQDIADAVADILRQQGVEIRLAVTIDNISAAGSEVLVEGKLEGKAAQWRADAVLVASGRVPDTGGLKLEQAGIAVNERGAIVTDKYLRTSQPHIWALGDVNGGPQFTYISLDDFRIVRDQLFGSGQRNIEDRGAIPYSVYMTPALSRVGLTERQAREQGYPVKVASLPVAAIPRAHTLNDTRGVLKVVVHQHNHKILGAALLCRDSYEMINLIKTVMDAGLPFTVLRDQIYTHPTMSESFNDLFALLG